MYIIERSKWRLLIIIFSYISSSNDDDELLGEVKVEIETLIVVCPFCNTYINEIHKVKSLNDLKITIYFRPVVLKVNMVIQSQLKPRP